VKRENIVGRANVEDTPELEAYYRSLEARRSARCGRSRTRSSPGSRSRIGTDAVKWQRIEPFVRRAPELVSAEKPRAAW